MSTFSGLRIRVATNVESRYRRVGSDGVKALFSCISSTSLQDISRRRNRNTSGNNCLQFVSLKKSSLNGIYGNTWNKGVQHRAVSSWLPEVVQNFSIWGGTGHALKAIHMDGTVPYWACFAVMSTGLRAALVPLVVHSAKISARFAKVAPELQFIITLFQNDLKKMRAEGKSLFEQRQLFLQNLQTVQSIYKLHNINPLLVFVSPLLQIPFFYYVAVDLRKIVNGQDPELAQELTEAKFLHLTDLTDPDPFYALPIAAGAMLYMNVEVAVGRRSLSGPTAAKSDFAGLLKDLFQTLAVFMPCLASQSPAGLQIYLLSSFTWTLFQGAALRNDKMRLLVGLPSMDAPPTEPKFAKQFMEFKKLEQKAKEIRGDGPVLGRNVLAVGFETSFPGSNRPSTIQGSDPALLEEMKAAEAEEQSIKTNMKEKPKLDVTQATAAWGGQFIHGISAPMEQLEAQFAEELKKKEDLDSEQTMDSHRREYLAQGTEDMMDAANKGVILVPKDERNVSGGTKLNTSRLKKRMKTSKKGRRKR